MKPLVSVIIPYQKDRGWLKEAINSVENQTYTGKIELILSQSPNGVSYNINKGIEKSKGEFIKFFAEDDLLMPNCISDSVDWIKSYDFIHGKAVNFFPDGRKSNHVPAIKYPNVQDLLKRNHIHGGTLFYRRDAFERFGLFDENLTTGEEYELNLRFLSKGARIGYCDKFLFLYRRHNAQKSLGKGTDQVKRAVKLAQIKARYERPHPEKHF